MEDSTTDLAVTSASAVVRVAIGLMDGGKISLTAGSDVQLMHVSEVQGDESINIVGELHVGTADFPRESCFGGGDSHYQGLSVLTNTNDEAGTWADITSSVNANDGSSVDMFPGPMPVVNIHPSSWYFPSDDPLTQGKVKELINSAERNEQANKAQAAGLSLPGRG